MVGGFSHRVPTLPAVTTYYETTVDRGDGFAALQGTHDADVAIVGGGFAGLATAFGLLERGAARGCLVLEGERIGHGASGRNGGFVFGGFSLDNAELLRQLGAQEARSLYLRTLDAVDLIRARIERHGIHCDAVHAGALLADWFGDDEPLRRVQRLMHDAFGVDWRWLPRDEVRALLRTERYHGALHEPHGFHFNPLKYALGEARVLQDAGVGVHERSRVRTMTPDGAGWRLELDGATVRCRTVVVCCGGYLEGLVPALARAVMPIATYVMTTEPLGPRLHDAMRTQAAVYDTRFAFDYYRPLPDTRLLWGGRISVRDRTPAEVQRLLTADLEQVYPQLRGVRIEHAWSGLMSYARHKMPQVGRLSDGRWYAMGFGGHGVAPTTLAGEVVAAALAGDAPIPAGLASYGLRSTFGPLGRAAAQASYWWYQAKDAWTDRRRR
jgi:gamma-glutamylputrescine oxidase